MSEPTQKPGKSKQNYGTPFDFIRAVEARWGNLYIDLACSAENAKAPHYITEAIDSFAVDWSTYKDRTCWLNPPFANIEKWAARCAGMTPNLRAHGGKIIMLTPASIGTEWFADHVFGKAHVVGIRPRLTFEGTTDPYPKDLMISIFGVAPGFDVWRWK